MRPLEDIELDRLTIHAFLGAGREPEAADKEEPLTEPLRRFFEQHIRNCLLTPSRRMAKFNGPDGTVAACAAAMVEKPETFVEQSKVIGLWFAHQMELASAKPTFLAIALFTDPDSEERSVALLRLDPASALVRRGSKLESISILPDPSRPLLRFAIVRPYEDESRHDVLFRNSADASEQDVGETDLWLDGFLEAYEVASPKQMTQLVVKETEKWIQANEANIQEETAAGLRSALKTMAQAEELDVEALAASAISDPHLREDYIGRLLDKGLTETAFQPDREWAERWSRKTTYLCDDGVQISGPSDVIDDVVQILPKTPDRKTRIVIETRKFIQK